MSVYEVTSRITHRWLMRKSKDELAEIIYANLDSMDLFREQMQERDSLVPHSVMVSQVDAAVHATREHIRKFLALSPCGECGGTGELINDGPRSLCAECNGTGIEKR